MATNNSLKNQLTEKKVLTPVSVLKSLLDSETVRRRFEPDYLDSILNLVSSDAGLQGCDPQSIIDSCAKAAALKLPVDRNLGYVFIVPGKDNKSHFEMGYKGYIQLALRTAQYKSINVLEVYEGEIKNWDPVTEDIQLDYAGKKSDAVIGYAGYFELLSGFRKALYWPKDRMDKDFGLDKELALKTLVRDMLSGWGLHSNDMQLAYNAENK